MARCPCLRRRQTSPSSPVLGEESAGSCCTASGATASHQAAERRHGLCRDRSCMYQLDCCVTPLSQGSRAPGKAHWAEASMLCMRPLTLSVLPPILRLLKARRRSEASPPERSPRPDSTWSGHPRTSAENVPSVNGERPLNGCAQVSSAGSEPLVAFRSFQTILIRAGEIGVVSSTAVGSEEGWHRIPCPRNAAD